VHDHFLVFDQLRAWGRLLDSMATRAGLAGAPGPREVA
jgi:hypothetical protein